MSQQIKIMVSSTRSDLEQYSSAASKIIDEIAADEAALHDPDLFMKHPNKFAALTKAIEAKRAEKDAAEHRWLEVAEMAEALPS